MMPNSSFPEHSFPERSIPFCSFCLLTLHSLKNSPTFDTIEYRSKMIKLFHGISAYKMKTSTSASTLPQKIIPLSPYKDIRELP